MRHLPWARPGIAARVRMLVASGAALALGGFQPVALAAPPIVHWTQPTGAQVWFAASPAVPILDVELDFDAGSRRDPADKAGLAAVTALMSQKGVAAREGEPALDENQLGEAWADLGASFDAGAGLDRTTFRLRTLTQPDLLEKAVRLAARQLGEASWPDDVWQRERQQLSAAIEEALTRPGPVARRAYEKAVYGPHPYGYQVTPQTLSRITVDDMRARYAELIRPCRARVSVVGAITEAQANTIVAQLLSHLPKTGACAALPPVAEVQPLKAADEIRVPFDSAQAHILMGQPGYKRSDPDFFALLVGNHILGGGGFASILTNQVREKRGLSYSVYSDFSPGRDAGAFTVGLQTRPDQAGEALRVARRVVADFVADGPTAAQLKAAKENLIGSFPLRLDSNAKLLGNVANIAWNDLPLDYLDHWTDRIGAVTAEQIKSAFQRVLQPDRMVTVIVGGSGTGPDGAAPAPAAQTGGAGQ